MKQDEEGPATAREPAVGEPSSKARPAEPEVSRPSSPAEKALEPGQRRAKRIGESLVTLHQLMMPEHANNYGHVHGGIVVKLCDEAAAICGMRHARRPVVTVAIDSMSFRSPVHTGFLVSISANITYVGKSSMEIGVRVLAEHPITGAITHTNSAYFVFVALDDQGKPCEVPGLELTTDDERRIFKEGEERQRRRRAAEQLAARFR